MSCVSAPNCCRMVESPMNSTRLPDRVNARERQVIAHHRQIFCESALNRVAARRNSNLRLNIESGYSVRRIQLNGMVQGIYKVQETIFL